MRFQSLLTFLKKQYRTPFKQEIAYKIFYTRKRGWYVGKRMKGKVDYVEIKMHEEKNPHLIGIFHTHPPHDTAGQMSMFDVFFYFRFNIRLGIIGCEDKLSIIWFRRQDFKVMKKDKMVGGKTKIEFYTTYLPF